MFVREPYRLTLCPGDTCLSVITRIRSRADTSAGADASRSGSLRNLPSTAPAETSGVREASVAEERDPALGGVARDLESGAVDARRKASRPR